jgi:hypothetical protein
MPRHLNLGRPLPRPGTLRYRSRNAKRKLSISRSPNKTHGVTSAFKGVVSINRYVVSINRYSVTSAASPWCCGTFCRMLGTCSQALAGLFLAASSLAPLLRARLDLPQTRFKNGSSPNKGRTAGHASSGRASPPEVWEIVTGRKSICKAGRNSLPWAAARRRLSSCRRRSGAPRAGDRGQKPHAPTHPANTR